MIIFTSYFYQIRNFPRTLIPLSTALGDPTWYHDNQGKQHQFFDKRGVLNGLRAHPFVPQMQYDGECSGKPCLLSPNDCGFLKNYRAQLDRLNFDDILHRFQTLHDRICNDWKVPDIDFALIVHEAPQNLCSERQVILRWFADNGMPINEWRKWELY